MRTDAETAAPKKDSGLCVAICLLFLFLSAYSHQRPFKCPTSLSRLGLLHALTLRRLNIDIYHEKTPDIASFDGHFYSDKAPGTIALALPAFVASAIVMKAEGMRLDSEGGWLFSSWVACAGSIGVIAGMGAGFLYRWLSTRAGTKAAFVTTLALFLGAAPLPYATMMFSHSLVVGLLAISLWAIGKSAECGLRVAKCETPEQSWFHANRWELLAGFGCGWALASEYTAGIAVAGLFLYLISHSWHHAIAFCVAAVPPLLLIPAYSFACFGNPFILPYSLNASFPEMRHGLYAIQWPDAETAFNLLFSPMRGLFFWTPFLAMPLFGYWQLFRNDRRLFWLTFAIPALQIVVISGRIWDWPAGPTLGPRYLAPILPLVALPCALGVQRFPKLGFLLASYSILITTLATLTNAAPPASYYNPLLDLHIPLLLKGELSPNLGLLLGFRPAVSVALFYTILIGGIVWLWRMLPKGLAVAGGNHS